MSTIEERVAYLEGRLGDHFAAVDDLRSTYRGFHTDSNRQFSEARAALELLRAELHQEFGRLDSKMDTQFRWLAGTQVTTMLAIGSAVVGLYFK